MNFASFRMAKESLTNVFINHINDPIAAKYYSFGRIILVPDVEGFLDTYNPLHLGFQQVRDVNTPKRSKWLFPDFPAIELGTPRHI
jgi:hypothetical protein